MSEKKIKKKENSAACLNDNKVNNLLHEMLVFNKTKKKFYCLYKKGIKYIVKKKGKEKEKNTINGSKYNKNININALENIVHKKFIAKYKRMPKFYNSYISHRLIHNINSHIVSLFKEYLIYGDIFEFLTKLYNKKKSLYLLKELLYYYIENNIIYPNYMVLPEGLYLFKNIQQKQRILDNQEENSKKKKKEKNEEDKILTSKVIDSILNQTDTSEARNCFGLDNNSIEGDDTQDINLLIETINKIENINDKNKIFQKKKLIRIINNKNLKNNNFIKLNQFIKKRNNNKNLNYGNYNKNIITQLNSGEEKNVLGELKLTISHYEDNKKQMNSLTNKREIGKKYYIGKFNSISNDNSNILNNKYFYNINDKKMNTIETTDIKPRKIRFGESKEENNRSLLNLNSPYIIKRPVKQSTSYKKNVSSNSCNNKINLKKNNNKFYNYSPEENKVNINSNNNSIYKKKINKIKTLNILSTNPKVSNKINLNINSEIYRTVNREKKYLNLKERINPCRINTLTDTKEEPIIYKKIQNNNLNFLKLNKKLSISKYRPTSAKRSNFTKMRNINEKISNQNFKSISKMIKRKFIIDDDENAYNTNIFQTHNNNNNSQLIIKNNTNIMRQKNNEKKFNKIEDEIHNNNNSQKNIYISNNITNNNYYTIDNNQKKNVKFLFNNYLDKNENNKRRRKLLVINSRTLNKNSNQESNALNINSQNNSILNSARYNEKYDTNSVIKKWILSPYKNGLINETSLKSLDKYSIKNLLNKFNDRYNYKDRVENKLNINVNNSELNYNKYNTINAQNNTKNENKIKDKKRYLILHNIKNINIKNLKNNNSRLIKVDHSDINKNNSFKAIKMKIPNLLEINKKKNDKI